MSSAATTRSHATAIGRTKASVPARHAAACMAEHSEVLDWGCGRGKDVEYFDQRGFLAYGYDPYHRPELPCWPYENITCFYVLNTLTEEQRDQCLQDMLHYAIEGRTRVFVAVRSVADVEGAVRKSWWKHEDGWITAKATFQAGFSLKKLRRLLEKHGVYVEDVLLDNKAVVMVAGTYRGKP